MINVEIKGFQDKLRLLKRYMESSKGKNFYTPLAELSVDIIFKRTKAGKGVFGTRNVPLKVLSRQYVLFRSKHAGDLGEFASVRRSNLTLTGQMLDSIIYKTKKGGFEVFVEDSPRVAFPDPTKGSSATNADIAEYQARKGRVFIGLSTTERNIVKAHYRRRVRTLARQIGLTVT